MLVLNFVLIQHLSFYYETAPYASGLYFTVVALVCFAFRLHHFELLCYVQTLTIEVFLVRLCYLVTILE